jgi:hypothetical protein
LNLAADSILLQPNPENTIDANNFASNKWQQACVDRKLSMDLEYGTESPSGILALDGGGVRGLNLIVVFLLKLISIKD